MNEWFIRRLNQRAARRGEEPFYVFGICCGAACRAEKNLSDQRLQRISPARYRCERCARKEHS